MSKGHSCCSSLTCPFKNPRWRSAARTHGLITRHSSRCHPLTSCTLSAEEAPTPLYTPARLSVTWQQAQRLGARTAVPVLCHRAPEDLSVSEAGVVIELSQRRTVSEWQLLDAWSAFIILCVCVCVRRRPYSACAPGFGKRQMKRQTNSYKEKQPMNIHLVLF